MVHRALFGSLERFFGILLEHYAGAFPLWLAPVQAEIIPITERQHEMAKKICAELRSRGLRVEIDDRSASMGAKIKDARNQRIQYMLIIGDQELENGTISVRNRKDGQLGELTVKEVAEKMLFEIDNKLN
jgi:threonyl-tRNA synthetase